MQMIDVLKRLAELDAQNPNIVKESADVAECGTGMMTGGMMDEVTPDILAPAPHAPAAPSTPASINMTAGSGDEVANMLATIMQLAGVKKVGEPDINQPEMGLDAALVAEPAAPEGPAPSAGEDMRSVLDKLNPSDGEEETDQDQDDQAQGDQDDDEEETDEGSYDNTPADPNSASPFSANQFSNQENQPGSGDNEHGKRRTGMQPAATFESLMAEYKKFVTEDTNYISIGQEMANDGITYSREKEDEIIDLMADYMKKSGMSSKAIRYYLSYDEDYISDQLSYLPRAQNSGMMEGKECPSCHEPVKKCKCD